jgi:glycosyltransferase involved in cell wall biosynthesis
MRNLNPAVSVIIPTYCEEAIIEGCLKSVVNQEFDGRIETIVVDSHSPDNTRAVAEKCADKVIDVKARGVGKARNAGAKVAESQLLLFLDDEGNEEYPRSIELRGDLLSSGYSGYW